MGFFSAVKKIFSSKPEEQNANNQQDKLIQETEIKTAEIEQEVNSNTTEIEQEVNSNTTEIEQEVNSNTTEIEQEVNSESQEKQNEPDKLVQKNLVDQNDDEIKNLTLALRQVAPKLSNWLNIILDDIEEANPKFWSRLSFLLSALETPKEEADKFVSDFKTWLNQMEYHYLNDFRSELQYRLTLALGLEDEEDERDILFSKVQAGLSKTRNQLNKGLQSIFSSHTKLGEEFFEELEELFIMSDMGTELSIKLVNKLRKAAKSNQIESSKDLLPYLQEEVRNIFHQQKRIGAIIAPEVVLVVGVNGVGKTTTIAKLAFRAKMQGKNVLVAGADTFRAAAVEQLQTWANRIGVDFYSKGSGSDPAAVAYEAMDMALKEKHDIVFIDTAGRLHNKSNLMDELQKIRNVIGKKHQGSPHRSVLIIDATTGQNALQQTKVFKDIALIDEIILTKLDGTAKGGVAMAVSSMFEVPISFIGLGEKIEDLRPFHADDFAKALLGDKILESES